MNIPDDNLMTVTASDLKNKNPTLDFLRREVKRHVKEIDRLIKERNRTQHNNLTYPIERNFAVTTITNATAQRYVYASILDQLSINGFECKLVINTQVCQFEITWQTELDRNEIARQNDIINRALDADEGKKTILRRR